MCPTPSPQHPPPPLHYPNFDLLQSSLLCLAFLQRSGELQLFNCPEVEQSPWNLSRGRRLIHNTSMDAAQPNCPVNTSNGAVPEKDSAVIAKLRKLKISAHRDYPEGCGPPPKESTQKKEEAEAEATAKAMPGEDKESKAMAKEIRAISEDEGNKAMPKEEERKAMLKESKDSKESKEIKAMPKENKDSKAMPEEREAMPIESKTMPKESKAIPEEEKSKVAEKEKEEKEKEKSKVVEKEKEEKEEEEKKKIEVEKVGREKPIRSTLRDYPEDCAPPKPDAKELKPAKSNLRDYPDGCGLKSPPPSSAPLQRKIETMEIKKSFQRKKRTTELESTEEMKQIMAAIDSVEEAPSEAPKNERDEGKERRNTSPMEKKSTVLSEVTEKTLKMKKKAAMKAISGGKEGSREKHKEEEEEEEEESVTVPTPPVEFATTSSFEHGSNGAEEEREEEEEKEAFVSAIAMLLNNEGGNVAVAASTMESPIRASKKEVGLKQSSAKKGVKVTTVNAKAVKKEVAAKQAMGSNKGGLSGGKGLRTPETTMGSQSKKRKIPETESKVAKLLNTPGSVTAGRKRKSVVSDVVTPDALSSPGQKKPRRSAGKSNKKVSSSVNTGDPRKDVVATLRLYDAARRYLLQKEELEGKQGAKTRSDLVAGSMINASGLSANRGEKMVGPVPGIEVGDQFYYRMELSCVGMHGPIQSGIEYLTTKESEWGTPVATSVIASSGCEEQDTGDSIVYTGQGGKSGGNLKQNNDQKLERGNLGLEGSKQHKTPVRVVRGIKDVGTPTGKIYSYDGLYTVESSYLEKTKEGFEEYKFKLVRIPGQPELGSNVINQAIKYCRNPLSREDVCMQDISKGKESLAVCVVNTIDDEGGPPSFVYTTRAEYPSDLEQLELIAGCECQGACAASQDCACFVKNGNEFAYLNSGTFIKDKGLIYECSSQCKCSTACRNRATQKGLKYHFEVFKKDNVMEWGVRSWESIPAGSFICEYTGKIVCDPETIELLSGLPFVMNLRQVFESSPPTWGVASPLFKEHSLNRTLSEPIDLVIDSRKCGNFSRFINHSSSPNVLVQCLLREHEDQRFPRVVLFAMDNIPPMTELTLDYGHEDE